jgi:hypothetical protein
LREGIKELINPSATSSFAVAHVVLAIGLGLREHRWCGIVDRGYLVGRDAPEKHAAKPAAAQRPVTVNWRRRALRSARNPLRVGT